MCDRPCSCVIYRGKRWDDQNCPHPEHGKKSHRVRPITLRCGCHAYPGELLDH